MTIAVLKKLCSTIPWCDPAVLEQTVELALEIAREGREGRRIGTLFTLGKAEAVLAASRPLILDPLAAHAPARTHITDPNLRGTIKELAHAGSTPGLHSPSMRRSVHSLWASCLRGPR